jgi:hypothetical protein
MYLARSDPSMILDISEIHGMRYLAYCWRGEPTGEIAPARYGEGV